MGGGGSKATSAASSAVRKAASAPVSRAGPAAEAVSKADRLSLKRLDVPLASVPHHVTRPPPPSPELIASLQRRDDDYVKAVTQLVAELEKQAPDTTVQSNPENTANPLGRMIEPKLPDGTSIALPFVTAPFDPNSLGPAPRRQDLPQSHFSLPFVEPMASKGKLTPLQALRLFTKLFAIKDGPKQQSAASSEGVTVKSVVGSPGTAEAPVQHQQPSEIAAEFGLTVEQVNKFLKQYQVPVVYAKDTQNIGVWEPPRGVRWETMGQYMLQTHAKAKEASWEVSSPQVARPTAADLGLGEAANAPAGRV